MSSKHKILDRLINDLHTDHNLDRFLSRAQNYFGWIFSEDFYQTDDGDFYQEKVEVVALSEMKQLHTLIMKSVMAGMAEGLPTVSFEDKLRILCEMTWTLAEIRISH